MRFQDDHVDHLRAVLVLKSQLSSGRFTRLLSGLDNPALARALEDLARDAGDDKDALAEIVRDWLRASDSPPPAHVEPTSRDLVETWATLQEAASERLRAAAAAAPTPALRARLDQLASRDAVHARLLRELL